MPVWILANIHRDSKARPQPFDFEEVVAWLGHGFHRTPPAPAAPRPDELHARLRMLATFYGDNGQVQEAEP